MNQKAIIVVGMHRSGTSAVSGMLSELGVFMGSSLFAAQKGVNEKGFFENSLLVDLNDKLLDERLLSWDHPLALSVDSTFDSNLTSYLTTARSIINKDYKGKNVWGMKDPRTSLVLPFWTKVLNDLDISVNFLLMLRHPMEVFASLNKRDSFSLHKATHLWLNYTLSSYFGSLNHQRVILKYDDLLNAPEIAAQNIFEKFSLGNHNDITNQKFVDKKLQNQRAPDVPNDELVRIAMDVYELLGKSNVDHDSIVAATEKYRSYLKSLSHVLIEHLDSVKKEEVYFKRHFLNAYESFWWKLSWPLKKVESLLRANKY